MTDTPSMIRWLDGLAPPDWVYDGDSVVRHQPSGQVVRAHDRGGFWRFSQNNVILGSVRKRTDQPMHDLYTAAGPEAQAMITRWTRWMQGKLCQKMVTGGTYSWIFKGSLIQGPTPDLQITTPRAARTDLEFLAGQRNGQVIPLEYMGLAISIPGSAHARMAILAQVSLLRRAVSGEPT